MNYCAQWHLVPKPKFQSSIDSMAEKEAEEIWDKLHWLIDKRRTNHQMDEHYLNSCVRVANAGTEEVIILMVAGYQIPVTYDESGCSVNAIEILRAEVE